MLKEEEIEEYGYCNYHEEPIDERTYRRKGCWGCHHFSEGKDFPYTFVSQACKELEVSESTIRRWIKKGKLKGYLFEQRRHTESLPSPKTYHIKEKSIEELKKKIKGR